MTELSTRIGVSKAAVSKYESDHDVPRPSVLVRLARELKVRTEFFLRQVTVSVSCPAYRKRSSLGRRAQEFVEASIVSALEKHFLVESLFPEDRRDAFAVQLAPVETLEDAEKAAETIRETWGLGIEPIDNLTALLEDHGVKVIMVPSRAGFDGFSCWANESIPAVVCPSDVPGDRQRFTLAHELGHLILDVPEHLDREKVAHRFAGALLAPKGAVLRELGCKRSRLTVDELMILKHEYSLSMQAWARRAFDLGVIREQTWRAFCRYVRRMKWRKDEPGDQVPEEAPLRFSLLLCQALAEDLVSPSTAAMLRGGPARKRPVISEESLRSAAESMVEEYKTNKGLLVFTTSNTEDIPPDDK
jgi:Zn-dependent peptidase ImmA (M78 family)/transcriptional regulator with XRE-family HTH domain